MSVVFSLQGYDVLCRSCFGIELPFPVTDNFVDAEFLIGGNRPTVAVPGRPARGNYAASSDVPVLQSYIKYRPLDLPTTKNGGQKLPLLILYNSILCFHLTPCDDQSGKAQT